MQKCSMKKSFPYTLSLVQKYKFVISEDTGGFISLCEDDFLRYFLLSPRGLAAFIPMRTLFIGVCTTHGTQLTRGWTEPLPVGKPMEAPWCQQAVSAVSMNKGGGSLDGSAFWHLTLFREPKSHTMGGNIPPWDSRAEREGLPCPAAWAVS